MHAKRYSPRFLAFSSPGGGLGYRAHAQFAQQTDRVQYRLNGAAGASYMRTEPGNTYNANYNVHSCLGFNVTRTADSYPWAMKWSMGTDSNGQPGNGSSGGALVVGGTAGELLFATIPTVNRTCRARSPTTT